MKVMMWVRHGSRIIGRLFDEDHPPEGWSIDPKTAKDGYVERKPPSQKQYIQSYNSGDTYKHIKENGKPYVFRTGDRAGQMAELDAAAKAKYGPEWRVERT